MTQQHHHMAPPPQMQQIPHQTPPQGSGTSFDPILFKIVRQKATGTNTGVFFYFKIYDKVYRGRRDSFSKDKSIMYLRCNTCPRSVNKVSLRAIQDFEDFGRGFNSPAIVKINLLLLLGTVQMASENSTFEGSGWNVRQARVDATRKLLRNFKPKGSPSLLPLYSGMAHKFSFCRLFKIFDFWALHRRILTLTICTRDDRRLRRLENKHNTDLFHSHCLQHSLILPSV